MNDYTLPDGFATVQGEIGLLATRRYRLPSKCKHLRLSLRTALDELQKHSAVTEAAKQLIAYDKNHYINNSSEYSDRSQLLVTLIKTLIDLEE